VFRIYRVGRVNGPWLWLAAEKQGVSGWVKREQVVAYDQAIDYFSGEIRANPRSSSAHHSRGLVRMEKGEYDKAIADYDEAIRLDPTSLAAYVARGNAWYNKKEYDKAIADDNEAIRLDPKDAFAYANRGLAWSAKKEYDRAVADYNEAIRLDPQDAWAYGGRAMAYLEASREITLSDCLEWLDATGQRGGQTPYILLISHFCLRRAHHDDDARRLLDEATRRTDTTRWPGPIIRYLRREIDGKALLAAATDKGKMTDAQVYLSLAQVLAGRPEEALPRLRWVRDHGDTTSLEYLIAVAELDRIEAGQKITASRP
jgi:tetratricopeptide (TPR) repeat protein